MQLGAIGTLLSGELDVAAVEGLALMLQDISASLTAADTSLIEAVSVVMTKVTSAGAEVGLSPSSRSAITGTSDNLVALRVIQGANRLGMAAVCDDGFCNPEETCSSCPTDCGSCSVSLGGPHDDAHKVGALCPAAEQYWECSGKHVRCRAMSDAFARSLPIL